MSDLLAHGADHASEGGDGLLFTAALVVTMVVLGGLSMVRARKRQAAERAAGGDDTP